MKRDELIAAGIAVYRVGEVFDTDRNGRALSADEKDRWFVSVLADSPLVTVVQAIPTVGTESAAWALAAQHVSAALQPFAGVPPVTCRSDG